MKLICCHIENFGKLQDVSVEFTEGLQQICEENGWGKSTFAAFIRAMFYGLDGERKRSIDENERKRYKPWQGGAFGGSLTFEVGEKQYTVTRIFREKEIQDEFELRDTKSNLISKDFSANLGEELFHINRESFLRTAFIGQSDCETAVTDDINAQIGNLTDNTKDLNSFESANARITELINSLTPNRVTGSLAKRSGEITKMERMVADGSHVAESLDTYRKYLQEEQEYYEQLKEQMERVCDQQAKVFALQVVLTKRQEWQRLKNNCERRKEELQSAKERFPEDVPPMEEAEAALTEALSLEKLSERVALYSFEPEEKQEFVELQERFAEGLPEQRSAEEILENAKELRALRRQQAAFCLTQEEREHLEDLEKVFADESQEVSEVSSQWNNCVKRQASLPGKQAVLEALNESREKEIYQFKKKKGIVRMGIVAGGILVLIGFILAAFFSGMGGAALAVIGAILLLVCFIVYGKIPNDIHPEAVCQMQDLKTQILEDEKIIDDTKAFIQEYISGKGYTATIQESQIDQCLQEITEKYYEYAALKKKQVRQQQSDKSKEMDLLCKKLETYLLQYKISFSEENFSDNMNELKNKAQKFAMLQEKKKQGALAYEQYAKAMQSVCGFLKKYYYFPENDLRKQLCRMKEDIDAYQDAVKWHKEATEVLEIFEEANGSILKEHISDKEYPTLEELNQTIQGLTGAMEKSHNAIVDYNRRLEDLQEQYDEWEENKLYLEELKVQQEQEKKKFMHLTKARLYLGLAKESITAKYAAPIYHSFSHYFEVITQNSTEKYRMDANTNLTLEEKGKQREINTLSAGYRDLVGICLRVALVDAMYMQEKPMLIMDDPFTNLDDRKTAAAMAFLQEIAEKYQVIYFTCSKGRCKCSKQQKNFEK